MDLCLFLFLLWSAGIALCDVCPPALRESFQSAGRCGNCSLLRRGIPFRGVNWTGFCSGDECFLFPGWRCGRHPRQVNDLDVFLRVTGKSCDIVDGRDRGLDESCLEKLDAEECGGGTSEAREMFGGSGSPRSARGAFHKQTTSPLPESSGLPNSETPPSSVSFCEFNEFFFEGHCYFLKSYAQGLQGAGEGRIPNVTGSCSYQHPDALGLAVESPKENSFVMEYFKNYFPGVRHVLTSGRRLKNREVWLGWNSPLVRGWLSPSNFTQVGGDALYWILHGHTNHWCNGFPDSVDGKGLFVMCERPYNPKNIQTELHETCLKLYRGSSCYNPSKVVRYCCAVAETGQLWFGCPESIAWKETPDAKCTWTCTKEGLFHQPHPQCRSGRGCEEEHGGHVYSAAAATYATSGCPGLLAGQSTWYCSSDSTFVGLPDYRLCCNPTQKTCRDTDSFLFLWMGCSSTRVTRTVPCPPGSLLDKVSLEWECREDGSFGRSPPDYSKCNGSTHCQKEDPYGREWQASMGETVKKACPRLFRGECCWTCQPSGEFDGDEPDCSRCRHAWMDEVDDKINNGLPHVEVLEAMEAHTEDRDLRVGYGHVLDLTSGCVSLFKKQNPGGEISLFDGFLRSYSRIFRNVAGNSTTWSSFSVANRRGFARRILATTQNASFANLEPGHASPEPYNATLASAKTDGFDFFVAYGPAIRGWRFPPEDFSRSDWQVEVREVQTNGTLFAVMGLVMDCSMSPFLFPRGNATRGLEMNGPAVTFAVATSVNGEAVAVPNVTVDLSFKHVRETRFPASQVIRRRLHRGEIPSGVVNSTLCHYYRGSDWSTRGCRVTFTSKMRTNCTCDHLSTIGLLMSVHKYEPDLVLEALSIVCSGITIVSLVLALLIFYLVDPDKSERSLIGKNLCLCLLLGHLMMLTVMDKKLFYISDGQCEIFALLLHYVFVAAFAWMFVEGLHLYRMLVVVFDSVIEYRWIYLLIGYGVPFVIVGVTQLIGFLSHEQPYGRDELCWLKLPNYIWAFTGPVIVSTLINLFSLIMAIRAAVSSKMRVEKSNFRVWVKGWISLSTLLGITWVFGLSYVHYNGAFVYVFVVLNGLQGFFIFLFRFLLSEQYRAFIAKKFKNWVFKSDPVGSGRSDNVRVDTKLFGISGSKSVSGKADKRDSGYDTPIPSGPEKQPREATAPEPAGWNPPEDDDLEIVLKPSVSVAYLRNKLIESNLRRQNTRSSGAGSRRFH